MKLAKVIGTVVSTRKEENIRSLKLLLLKDLDLELAPRQSIVVAADAVGAGIGEVVLYATGSAARQTEQTHQRPVDSVIMAIVDLVEVEGEIRYRKDGLA
ncbi:MAG: EutN/CcmL family microcompartment protein [Myxococcota bacterium]|jgi:microcompartment protein CcmK/EutM|nr:EutN/CcmL family microcompartment protein [Myxococcota bacterium]